MSTNIEYVDRAPKIRDYFKVSDLFFEAHPSNNQNRRSVICPYCSDTSKSATVDEDGFICYQCHTTYQGAINFWMHEYGVTFLEALDDLWSRMDGGNTIIRQSVTKDKPLREHKASIDKVFTMNDVFPYYKNIDTAMPYYQSRGISVMTAHHRRLGYVPDETTKPYVDRDDNKYWLKSPHYVIPYLYGEKVLTMNMRLDEAWCMDSIQNINDELMPKLIEDFTIQNNGNFDPKKFLRACYGPKYWNKGGYHIYNLNRVLPTNGSNPIFDYVLLVEGEMDAIAAEESGFPAIAAKHFSSGLIEAVSKVKRVIVVQDNDPDTIDHNGKVVNNAKENAEKMVARINSEYPRRAMIVVPTEGCKDVNDLHVANKLDKFMELGCGIKPTIQNSVRKRTRTINL